MEIDDQGKPEDAESARLIDLCQRSQIHITDRHSGQRDVPITNGQHAFFALLLKDMEHIADWYNKPIKDLYQNKKPVTPPSLCAEDCIKIFYEVSGDRNKLLSVLKNRRTMHEISVRKHRMQQDTFDKKKAAQKKAKDDGDEEYTISTTKSNKKHTAPLSAKKKQE